MNWTSYPLARIGILFISGILLEPLIPDFSLYAYIIIIILYLGLLLWSKKKIVFSLFQSILLLAFSFVFGIFIHEQKNQQIEKNKLPDGLVKAQCVVKENIVKKKKYKTVVEILYFTDNEDNKIYSEAYILLYFDIRDSIVKTYKKGDVLYVEGKIQSIPNNSNPGYFNMQTYYKNRGVLQQLFVKPGQHYFYGKNINGCLIRIILNIRNYWNHSIQHLIKESDRRAVIKALLLGDNSEIEKEVFESFSETGAIHVLAVSGLHVGAVLYVFVLLFKLIRQRWIHVWIKPFFLIFFAFSYVILTGASPSVIRSAVMFGMVIIGKEWFRNVNTINILFVSAIWMLLYNPYFVYDLSFQFSYLSLLSIILMQPHIKLWYIPDHRFTKYIWELISVSVAAQFFVFPLSLYYFNQFPVYFIFSNIIAVPMAIFLVYGGFFIPLFDVFTLNFLQWYIILYSEMTGILIYVIQKIQNMPGALIDNIWLQYYQVIIWYGAVVYLLIYTRSKKANHFYIFLFLVFAGSLPFYTSELLQKQQNKICFYESKNGHIVDFVSGNNILVYKGKNVTHQNEEFISLKNRIKMGAKNTVYIDDSLDYSSSFFKKQKQMIDFYHIKIYFLSDYLPTEVERQKVDYLIVGKGNKHKSSFILELIKPDTIILLSSIEKYKKEWWKICALENNVPLLDLQETGYYVIQANIKK